MFGAPSDREFGHDESFSWSPRELSPSIKVFGIPYIFKDKAHTFRVLDGPIGDELLNGTEKYWLKGLGYYDSGAGVFTP